MKFFYILATVFAIPNPLHAMFPLNSIEKALVLREIQLRGLTAIEEESKKSSGQHMRAQSEPVLHTPQPTIRRSSSDRHIPRTRIPVLLTISDTFCRPDQTEAHSDALTIAIFNKIDQIESQHGYNPTAMETIDGHYCYTKQATNNLGTYTRYHWLENDKNIIQIKSCITNEKDLQEIINQEKMCLVQVTDNKQHITH